jgi:O-antigen/teichoic acid export membrane protein
VFNKLARKLLDNREKLQNYAASTASMVVALVAHSIGFIVLARVLGTVQFGQLTIITTFITLGLVWCGLGSGEMLRRHVARDRAAYAKALGHTIVLVGITCAIIGVVLIIGMAAFLEVTPEPGSNLVIISLFVISNTLLFSVVSLTEVIFLSHDKIKLANIVNAGSGIGRAATVLVACYGFGVTDLEHWAYWHFGFYLVVSAACIIALIPYGAPKFCVMRSEIFRGFSVSITGLLVVLRQNADILALSAVASPAIVGIYGVARRLVSTASVVSASLDRLVYSNLAIAGKNGVAATLPLVVTYAGYATILCGVTTVTLYFAAPYVPLVFGSQYASAITTVQILSGTLILTSLQWLALDALNAAEQHTPRLLAETLSGLLGTALLVVLTLNYGLPGILASVYISGILVAVALWSMLFWLARNAPNQRISSTA